LIRKVAVLAALALAAVACTGSNDDQTARPAAPSSVPTVRGSVTFPSPAASPPKPADGWLEASCDLPFEYVKRIRLGLNPEHSPDITVVPREPNFFGGFTSTTHSGPWDYVQEVPVMFWGPGYVKAQGPISLPGEPTLTDFAPTLADLLHTPLPDAQGRSISEALVPEAERQTPPKAILTVVWDGGGWDVLNTWPDAWPFLRKLMSEGTLIDNVIDGSSPSVTPAIHATIGTGTYPKTHGIVDIPVREDDANVVGAYAQKTPDHLKVPTLADLYDQTTGNVAKIGMLAYKSWHLGMVGHGAYMEGGDNDIAVIAEKTAGHLVTNPEWYSLPPYLQHVGGYNQDVQAVDGADGKIDGAWMGHDVLEDPGEARHTPAWTLYQTSLVKKLLETEGYGEDDVPDLFFVNYKQVDDVGHDWNMLHPEMENILEYSDDALKELVRFMNEQVGEGQWVLAFTADHGQTPDPQAVGAWPIHQQVVTDAIAEHFGVTFDELFQDTRPVGFWLDPAVMAANGITDEEVSDFLVNYRLKDDVPGNQSIPQQYQSRLEEPVFSAAFPSDQMGKIWHCAKANR
jgi:predicted AlkP superfamily pyrophosphatase or phosphodiesterase